MRRISSGELVIPVAVYEEKMEELKIAERVATETRMLALECTERNFDAIRRVWGLQRIFQQRMSSGSFVGTAAAMIQRARHWKSDARLTHVLFVAM
jgi:hypothetical protein